MANRERNGGSGAITVTININGRENGGGYAVYRRYSAMHQTVVFLWSGHHFTCSDISVSFEGSCAHHARFRLAAGDGFPGRGVINFTN